MYELERNHLPERLSGNHVEIKIVSPNSIRELFKSETGHYIVLNHSQSDDLPEPIKNSRLELWKHGIKGSESMPHASIVFNPPKTHKEDSWQDAIRQEIYEQVDVTQKGVLPDVDQLICIPHDINAFYARISEDYYARIAMSSDLRDCQLDISVEHREIIEEVLGRHIDYDSESTDIDEYDRLLKFTDVWLKAMDSVASVYVTNPKVFRKYYLNIDVPPSAQNQDEEANLYEDSESSEMAMPDIEKTIITDLSFAMMGGLTEPKRRLRHIMDVFRDPKGAQAYGISGSHFILYGPPGTGKTSLIEALGYELNAQIFRIPSTKIVSKWIGQSAENAQEVFEDAKRRSEYSPVIMFFDEIDSLIGTNGHNHRERIDIVKVFNAGITDIVQNHSDCIIIAGATNADLNTLEPSIIRSGRLEPIAVPLPDMTERQDIWAAVLAKSYLKFENMNTAVAGVTTFLPYTNDINTQALAIRTEGMTGADFELILEKARIKQYAKYRETQQYGRVSQADILDEIEHFYRR